MKIEKYDILALTLSAMLSFFAFAEANDKPDVQVIEFSTPIVITASK